jgi:hypothetical protein
LYGLDFLEEYVVKWQGLFPYKIFASTELIKELICCSVCGERIGPRVNCGHEAGEIYDGEMCCRVVEKVDLVAIAMVENPANKFAVAFMSDPITKERRDHYNYAIVSFAVKALASPYSRWDYTRMERRQPHSRYPEVGRNGKCPCGSGKKYKQCCLKESGVLAPHIEFRFAEPPNKNIPSLSYVSEWRTPTS